jgi:4-amino-4-deoxy-L-arabinose transferase-like glycosyltransferase
VGTLVARLIFGYCLGLGVDESYAVATGRHPQLSTYDHPPAAWWLAWGAGKLFATESALALRLPFILLFSLTTWVMYRLTAYLFGDKAGFWAAATLNLAPVLAWTSGTWIVPDGPLDAALVAGVYATALAIFDTRSNAHFWWLAAGICGGLALLSKFHGVFLFTGVGLFLLTCRNHRSWLMTPWPYLGALLAVVLFLPVIVWNEQHGWASFVFQGGRARPSGIDPLALITALGGQAVYLSPWLWLSLIVCLGDALLKGPTDPRRWMMACLAIGPIVVFTAVGLTGTRVLPHWAAQGYLMLFPLVGAEVATALENHDRYVRTWLTASAATLFAALVAAVAMSLLPWPTIAGRGGKIVTFPLLESVAWVTLKSELEVRGLADKPGLFIAATRWHEAAKIDYALGGRLPVLCLCGDPRGYGVLTRPEMHLGETALLIGRDLSQERIMATYATSFDSLEQMPPIAITHAGKPLFELSVYLGHGFRLVGPSSSPNSWSLNQR